MASRSKNIADGATNLPKEVAPKNITEQLSKEELEEKKEQALKSPVRMHDFFNYVSTEPFLGLVFSRITKKVDWDCPTAYVAPVYDANGHVRVIMGYNPLFLESIQERKHRFGVFTHEIYHVILSHIFERSIGDLRYAKLFNIATDLAINSMIGAEGLPDIALYPGRRPKTAPEDADKPNPYADFIENAPTMQSSEWYFKQLKNIAQENGDDKQNADGSSNIEQIDVIYGVGSMDDHEGWGAVDPDVAEELRNEVKQIISEAATESTKTNQWGSVPAHMQDQIRALLSNEIDWRRVVRNFIGRVRTTDRNSTIKRLNKKVPYIFPGVKRKTIPSFAVFIDQSGSMSNSDIATLFGELQGLAKKTDLDVFFFDTQVDENHFLWKKGKNIPELKRHRCGGTDFNAVADFCNNIQHNRKFSNRKHTWSGIIILTDGYAPTMKSTKGTKVLWVVTESGTKEYVRPGDLVCQMSKSKGSFDQQK